MKKAIFLLIPLFLVSIAGCSTSEPSLNKGSSGSNSDKPNVVTANQYDNYHNLVDFLRRIPGVQISGSPSNPSIIIRGVSSFSSAIEPLYVLNGQPIGTNYAEVNGMLNVNEIVKVEVLKGGDAAIFGMRGSNGVILISTR